MGQSSPNGFFSQDSADSGESQEFYLAKSQVYPGDYQFVVNYYADGASCSQARAHLLLFDPADQQWHELTSQYVGFAMDSPSPQIMDLSNQYTSGCGDDDLACYDQYSDWWIPDVVYEARMISDRPLLKKGNLPTKGKKSQMVFRFGKGMRMFSR